METSQRSKQPFCGSVAKLGRSEDDSFWTQKQFVARAHVSRTSDDTEDDFDDNDVQNSGSYTSNGGIDGGSANEDDRSYDEVSDEYSYGYDEGYNDGRYDGYNDGCNDKHNDDESSYDTSYDEGYDDGYEDDSVDDGDSDGFDDGEDDGSNDQGALVADLFSASKWLSNYAICCLLTWMEAMHQGKQAPGEAGWSQHMLSWIQLQYWGPGEAREEYFGIVGGKSMML